MADPVYQKVKKDPTPATERKVLQVIRELEKEDLIPRNLAAKPKPSASKPPKLHGPLKVHKKEVLLHLVVSCTDSSTYHLAKYVNTLISPLAGETSFFIKNTKFCGLNQEHAPPTNRSDG